MLSEEDYFILRLHKLLPENISIFTYNSIIKIFRLYTFKYDFKRENVMSALNIKKTKASEIIKILLEVDLIKQSGPAQYKFKK